MVFNPDITKQAIEVIFSCKSRKNEHPDLTFSGIPIASKPFTKYVDRNALSLSYKMYIRPHLDYGDVTYHNQRADLMDLVERVQYKSVLIVSECWQGTS